MKFKARSTPSGGSIANRRRRAAFTLAEVLAALVFMAIVIPVSVEGVRIASRAGVVAQRKGVAVRLAENLLNELIVTGHWQDSPGSGRFPEAPPSFRWTFRNDQWQYDNMRLLTVEVLFDVQNQEYSVEMSTLTDSSTPQTNQVTTAQQ